MSKRESDILQIRKYLNGELDAKAMHQLERRAQDDPFLMDAMEGYQISGGDQQANLADISERLNQRISEKSARIIPLRIIGIAASVLIVCSVGIWWLQSGKPSSSSVGKQAALVVKPASKTIVPPTAAPVVPPPLKPAMESSLAKQSNKQAPAAKTVLRPALAGEAVALPADTSLFVRKSTIAESNSSMSTADQANKDTTPLNEMIVMGYKTNKKKDTARTIVISNDGYLKKYDTANPVQLLQARTPGVTVTTTNSQRNLNGLNLPPNVADKANQLLSQQISQGEALARDNANPLPSAPARAAAAKPGSYADPNSKFAAKADSAEYKSSQYKGGQIMVRRSDPAKKMAAKPGVGNALTSAHPQKGWDVYKKYLSQNAVSPDGMAGVVKLTFMVDRDGKITAIKVIKGISVATDQKAIKIINDGPPWAGNANDEPEKVSLEIKFDN